MATRVCEEALRQVLGKKVTKAKVKNVEKILRRKHEELARADPQTWNRLTEQERVVAATDRAVAELRGKQNEAVRRAVQGAQKRKSSRLSMERFKHKARNWATALVDYLNHIDATAKALYRQFSSEFEVFGREAVGKDVKEWFQNPKNVLSWVTEVEGTKTTNKEAGKLAKLWTDFTDGNQERLRRAGANPGKLAYGWIPHLHDDAKIRKTSEAEWVEKTLPHLKRDYYVHADGSSYTDDELREMLRRVKVTLDTNGINKLEPGQRRGTGTGAARIANQHRELHFTSEGFVRYSAEFGRGTMLEAIQSHLHKMSRDLALFENLGPDPEGTFRYLKDTATKRDGSEQTAGLGGYFVSPEEMWSTVSGAASRAQNQTVADWYNNFANIKVAAVLNKAVIASISDFASTFTTARYHKLPFWDIYFQGIKLLGTKEGREALKLHGMIVESEIGDINRFILDNMKQNWSAAAANFALKIQGLHAVTNVPRNGFAAVMMRSLAEMKKKSWAELSDFERDRLEVHDITSADWAAWQQAETSNLIGNEILSKTGIQKLTDDQLRGTVQPRIDEIKMGTEAAIRKLMARNAQDHGWVAAREGRLAELTQELEARLQELEADKTEQATNAKEYIRAQIDALEADRDFSRVRSLVDEEALTDGFATRLRVREYLKAGGKPDAGVKTFGGSQVAVGKALGRKEVAARTKVKEANARIRKIDKATRDYLDQKFGQVEKRLLVQRKALNEFTRRSEARQQQRDLAIKSVLEKAEREIADEVARARDQAVTKYVKFINDESHYTSLAPDALARTAFVRGTRAGSPLGVMLRFMSLFSTFPLTMTTRHWRRASRLGKGGQASYLISLLISSTIMGALIVQIRNMIYGKDPEDMSKEVFWLKAMIYGGASGWYGDAADAALGVVKQRSGRPELGGIFGGGFDVARDVTETAASGLKAATGEGSGGKFATDLYRTTKGFIPFGNSIPVEMLLERPLMHQLLDDVNPGYLRRMTKATKKNQGVDYFWRPGEALPERAPDFGSAIGE